MCKSLKIKDENQDRILESVLCILKYNFQINLDTKNFEVGVQNFFEHNIGFTSVEMVYLTHILEQKYGIQFTAEDMDDLSFYTINGISRIILNHLSNKS